MGNGDEYVKDIYINCTGSLCIYKMNCEQLRIDQYTSKLRIGRM